MSKFAIQADTSINMESLRAARSYNDTMVVLSRIKTLAINVKNNAMRNIVKYEPSANLDDKQRKAIKKYWDSLHQLLISNIELQYAKTFDTEIIHKSKMDKYRKVCNSVQSEINLAENSVYKVLDLYMKYRKPDDLTNYVGIVSGYVSKLLTYKKIVTFTLPSEDAQSMSGYIVLHSVSTSSGYVLPTLIICINAVSNMDSTYSYTVEFPSNVNDEAESTRFSNQKKLLEIIRHHIASLFNISNIKDIPKKSKKAIKALDGVHNVEFNKGSLNVELISGISGQEINNIITNLLSVLDDPDEEKDIIHRMFIKSDDTKVIQFTLMDRNFSGTSTLGQLKKLLGLKPKFIKEIQASAGIS